MRKLTQLVLFTAALIATPAFAEMKVAVLNYQMALLESDAAKRYAVDAEKKFGPQLNKLKTLESDAKRIAVCRFRHPVAGSLGRHSCSTSLRVISRRSPPPHLHEKARQTAMKYLKSIRLPVDITRACTIELTS